MTDPAEAARAERAALKTAALEQLRAANPGAREDKIQLYVDAWVDYRIAQSSIDEHGSIVLHPQTNAPIDNPHTPTRDRARKVLEQRTKLAVGVLWARK